MATNTSLDEMLSALGYDSQTKYNAPEDPFEASMASVNAFAIDHSEEIKPRSIGFIHLTGPNVVNHSAPVKAVGDILTAIQDGVDAIGASLSGIITSHGALPFSVTGRTQLSMISSPMPGSVIIQVAPTISKEDDLNPQGEQQQQLFDMESEINARPLADRAFTEFSSLIKSLGDEGPDKTAFLDRLTDYGPRVASTMKNFCDSIDKGAVDIELKWKEPGHPSEESSLNHEYAKHASTVIQNANIESETVQIEGTILTLTTSPKDKLRVLSDTEQEFTIAIGTISPSDVYAIHTGDRVHIEAERRISKRPGGRRYEKLIGVSLTKLPTLNEG